MEITPLRYLQTIAQTGSLSAAARTLHVTQPTLTIAMRNLESELGTTLLHRDRRGVRLTSTGQELLHYATEILSLCDRATIGVHGLETEHVGQFKIGCPEALGAYFLPEFLKTFLQNYPRIELSLWNGPSRKVEEAVLARTVHFGLVANPLPHPELVLVPLFEDTTQVMITRKRHSERTQEQLIFVADLPQTQQVLKELGRRKLLPRRLVSVGSLELVKSFTNYAVGIGLLPRRVATYGGSDLVPYDDAWPIVRDRISLAYRSDLHRSRAANRVKEALAEHGRNFASK